jgi:hypothetical protein
MRYVFILMFVLPAACTQVLGIFEYPKPSINMTAEQPTDLDQSDVDASAAGPNDADTGTGLTGLTGPARTVAGLGDPTRPGLWLETPLVQAAGAGRVRLVSGGASVQVTLLPTAGEASAGSRLSLDAMRQLGAPLTELFELVVSPAG